MAKAWNRGISTHEFRKCLTSDIEFIIDLSNSQAERAKQNEHEQEVIRAMQNLQMR